MFTMNRWFYLPVFLLVVVGSPIGCNVTPPGSVEVPDPSPDEPGGDETPEPSPEEPGTPEVPEPSAEALPDFSLPDVNPNSVRYQETVSPRDYLGQISAWYFGHST